MKRLTKNHDERNKSITDFLNAFGKVMMMIFLIFSLFLLIFGIKTFWLGFHSIDLGQNMRYLNAELKGYNFTLIESPVEGLNMSGEQVFRLGVFQLESSFWTIIFSSLILGMCIMYFLLESIKKK